MSLLKRIVDTVLAVSHSMTGAGATFAKTGDQFESLKTGLLKGVVRISIDGNCMSAVLGDLPTGEAEFVEITPREGEERWRAECRAGWEAYTALRARIGDERILGFSWHPCRPSDKQGISPPGMPQEWSPASIAQLEFNMIKRYLPKTVSMSDIDSPLTAMPNWKDESETELNELLSAGLTCMLRPTGNGRFTTTARNQHLFRLYLTVGRTEVVARFYDPDKLLPTADYEKYR